MRLCEKSKPSLVYENACTLKFYTLFHLMCIFEIRDGFWQVWIRDEKSSKTKGLDYVRKVSHPLYMKMRAHSNLDTLFHLMCLFNILLSHHFLMLQHTFQSIGSVLQSGPLKIQKDWINTSLWKNPSLFQNILGKIA